HYSDFIFSIICEEGGFILGGLVIGLFVWLLQRGIYISWSAKDKFSCYLGVGLTLFIIVQAFINIGVVIGVLPITGIPLTFISYGGTSLVMSLFFSGVILNISRTKHCPE
ncbi:MAG: FtsW/RodA/SpoVE family cell cycle protein, partial [Candidatus Margulisbacteria bacterium]|nr:FtsW/RodA/SpoVE family cell cycle protein [Candidatus Margulisiibacteriota bacterium]